MHNVEMILDFQYGSTGKGLIAGWLASRGTYDTAMCAFATNAGHTYITPEGRTIMTQQLPTSIISKTVKTVLLGPGSAIDLDVLSSECFHYADLLVGKEVLIHPQAAVVTKNHADFEMADGRSKMGSTGKGVGEAYIERMRRKPDNNTAKNRWGFNTLWPNVRVCDETEYRERIRAAENVIVEGAQGFGLSMYHGQYPYVTSRDVTPWQIAADCGLPLSVAPYIKIIGTLRTYPIRVNNRDGSSGPCYPDQKEITFESLGLQPELTTVTKLPRRIFTFSYDQLRDALFHCGQYWDTRLFLNFCNYMHPADVETLISAIQSPGFISLNAPKVAWTGHGPNDSDVLQHGVRPGQHK